MAISFLLAEFDCTNLPVKISDVNLSINKFVVIIISSIFIYNCTSFWVIVSFLSKILTLGILFWTGLIPVLLAKLVIFSYFVFSSFILALRAVVVAPKLVTLGISFLTSFILALRVVLVAKLVIT